MPTEWLLPMWTIVVASLCGAMCAALGVWLVLQRQSMVGDALSHSVLPGLALVFIWFGTRATVPMLAGALVAGLVTVALTRLIAHLSGVREDGALGVVFTLLFAVGVLLITRYAAQVDLDPGCVLYGLVEFVGLDTFALGGWEVPRVLASVAPSTALVGVFLLAFRRELALMAFDPALAGSLGKRPGVLNAALMALVAVATVASFEAVGSIIVIAMLVGPAATAQLVTRRLGPMFAVAIGLAVLACVLGYLLAARWNTSVAGMIAVVIGLEYASCALLLKSSEWLRRKSQRRSLQF